MADLDVLVLLYDLDLIKSVMKKLSFSGSMESSWKHDRLIKKDVHEEIHKRLTGGSEVIQMWKKGISERSPWSPLDLDIRLLQKQRMVMN